MKGSFISLIFIVLVACELPRQFSGNNYKQISIATDTLSRDTLIKFRAQPKQGFNFDYFIFLPKGLKINSTTYLLVETTNTGLNDSIEYHEKGAMHAAGKSSLGNYVARKIKVPLLVPIFLRPATQWQLYTHALDRETMLTKEFGLERLDLQLLAMIIDAKSHMAKQGLILNDKFLMVGFSASGTFANRFSILHSKKLKATASGGINAMAILPVTKLGGKMLNYPLGIADVKELTGKKININSFNNLAKFLFMGELDNNDAVAFNDAYSDEERTIVYDLFGKQMIPKRWRYVQQLYSEYGIKADFKTYPGIGHGTDLKINTDLVEFFKKQIAH